MNKPLDPPSKIVDRVIALAADVKLAWENAAATDCRTDPVEDHVMVLKAERSLRKYLGQQKLPALRLVMLVSRIGTGQLLPEQLRERLVQGSPKMMRLEHVMQVLVSDRELAGHLAEGIAKLEVKGIRVGNELE